MTARLRPMQPLLARIFPPMDNPPHRSPIVRRARQRCRRKLRPCNNPSCKGSTRLKTLRLRQPAGHLQRVAAVASAGSREPAATAALSSSIVLVMQPLPLPDSIPAMTPCLSRMCFRKTISCPRMILMIWMSLPSPWKTKPSVATC